MKPKYNYDFKKVLFLCIKLVNLNLNFLDIMLFLFQLFLYGLNNKLITKDISL